MELQINGQTLPLDVPPDKPLLWVLREELGMTGTKYCCGAGDCGVCLVHVDGEAAPSCQLPVGELRGREVVTIEGLAARVPPHPVLDAWHEAAVPQCGYCQPAQVMAAAALFAAHPNPTEAQIAAALDRVLCRCGTYTRIRRAVDRLRSGAVGP